VSRQGHSRIGLNLSYDNEQVALQALIAGFCAHSGLGPLYAADEALPDGFWLGLGTDEGGAESWRSPPRWRHSDRSERRAIGRDVYRGALLDADWFRPVASGEQLVSVVQHSTAGTSDSSETGIRSADIRTPSHPPAAEWRATVKNSVRNCWLIDHTLIRIISLAL
jgi:hypothetical protein